MKEIQPRYWFLLSVPISTVILIILLCRNHLINPPVLAIILGSALLGSTAALSFLIRNSKAARGFGISICVLLSILLLFCCYAIGTMGKAVSEISGKQTKTSTIVIAVASDDPAQSIYDIEGYRIGRQATAHKEETDRTIETIESQTGFTFESVTYDTIQEEADALLSGEIGAAVYSDGFTAVLGESIEGWSDKVRILSSEKVETETVVEEQDITEPFCIYLSGIDTEGTVDTMGRSDVNIIAAVNPKKHSILLVTTPRDYYVEIPGISGGQRDKLTHAGIYGPDVSIRTLEEIYGIPIHYYAKLNFTSLVAIINTLGGIDVNVEQSFTVGPFEFQEGIQHMEGEMALAYCRERKSFIEGDLQRGKNQEAVLTAIIRKCLSPEILIHAARLTEELAATVETSMGSENIMGLVNMQLSDMGSWEIISRSANGTSDMQPCYSYGSTPLSVVWPDEESVDALKEELQQHQAE